MKEKKRIPKDDMESLRKIGGKWEKWILPNMDTLVSLSLR